MFFFLLQPSQTFLFTLPKCINTYLDHLYPCYSRLQNSRQHNLYLTFLSVCSSYTLSVHLQIWQALSGIHPHNWSPSLSFNSYLERTPIPSAILDYMLPNFSYHKHIIHISHLSSPQHNHVYPFIPIMFPTALEGPLATSAYTFYWYDSFSLEDSHNRLTLAFSVKAIITPTRHPVKPSFHKPTLMPHPTSFQYARQHNPDNIPSPLTTWDTIFTFGFLFRQDYPFPTNLITLLTLLLFICPNDCQASTTNWLIPLNI